jgi:hypothetical protein
MCISKFIHNNLLILNDLMKTYIMICNLLNSVKTKKIDIIFIITNKWILHYHKQYYLSLFSFIL